MKKSEIKVGQTYVAQDSSRWSSAKVLVKIIEVGTVMEARDHSDPVASGHVVEIVRDEKDVDVWSHTPVRKQFGYRRSDQPEAEPTFMPLHRYGQKTPRLPSPRRKPEGGWEDPEYTWVRVEDVFRFVVLSRGLIHAMTVEEWDAEAEEKAKRDDEQRDLNARADAAVRTLNEIFPLTNGVGIYGSGRRFGHVHNETQVQTTVGDLIELDLVNISGRFGANVAKMVSHQKIYLDVEAAEALVRDFASEVTS